METANLETGAAEQAPDSSSFDDKLAAKLGFGTETAEPAEQPAAPEATAEVPEGELSADDVAENDPAPSDDWLEIDRKGEKRRISKEEAKRLAQQGWDYSTQVERLKAEEASIIQLKAAVTARAQLTPQVVEAAANVKSYERALQQYQGLDWARLAQEDPLRYTATRAQYDQLRDGYGQATASFQQVANAAQTADRQIAEGEYEKQRQQMLERKPEWRDEQRFAADAGRIKSYLQRKGVSDKEIAGIMDSRIVDIFHDAMRYDQAVKARQEREAKNSPAVLKPGAAPVRANPKTQLQEDVKALHQAKDPERKKALLDKVLEKKLARFIP